MEMNYTLLKLLRGNKMKFNEKNPIQITILF